MFLLLFYRFTNRDDTLGLTFLIQRVRLIEERQDIVSVAIKK